MGLIFVLRDILLLLNKPRSFQEGDLVWRMKGEARKTSAEGKFSSNGEGPFKVKESLHNGAYGLQQLDGQDVSST